MSYWKSLPHQIKSIVNEEISNLDYDSIFNVNDLVGEDQYEDIPGGSIVLPGATITEFTQPVSASASVSAPTATTQPAVVNTTKEIIFGYMNDAISVNLVSTIQYKEGGCIVATVANNATGEILLASATATAGDSISINVRTLGINVSGSFEIHLVLI